MKSQIISKDKTCQPRRLTRGFTRTPKFGVTPKGGGFTLMEIMMVVALAIAVVGLSLFFDLDSFRGYSFHSDRNVLISALQHARAEAMANICRGSSCTDGKPHGVAIRPTLHPNSYVIFQGASYASADHEFDAVLESSGAMIFETGSLTEVVFSQLSGDVASPGDISIKDGGIHSSVITITDVGQIVWTN